MYNIEGKTATCIEPVTFSKLKLLEIDVEEISSYLHLS